MIERDPFGYIMVIFAMTVAVYLTRAGGYWLMGRVTIGPRVRRVFDALPGAIIAATVAPLLLRGGVSALCAVVAAGLAMIFVRRDFAAVIVGVAVAAAVRAAGL
ncbi:MAG: AzlD domain-containing protein [Rhizobiales bacterium]|nr:AzlD domain-containing protein [Hyphomicrobiales bacterium]